MTAKYLGEGIYEVERRGGFLWLRKYRAKAHWVSREGWCWCLDDEPIDDFDVRLALSEARLRDSRVKEDRVWEEV